MTTELTTIDNMSFAEVAALTGAQVREATILPRLQINREPEDDAGNKLPMGHYTVTQGDTKVFGSTALFRPFINSYQYFEYSPTEDKYINRSIIIKSFNEEAIDLKGGLACGKVPFKQLGSCSPEEQLRQKNIKCRRHLYGLVSLLDSVNAEGDHFQIEELPVLWSLSGGNFLAPDEALKTITKLKHQFFQHNFSLKTKREKKGSTIYYNAIVEPDYKNLLTFTESDFEIFKMFQEVISRENNYVAKMWRETKRNEVKLMDVDYLKELDLNDPLPDNL